MNIPKPKRPTCLNCLRPQSVCYCHKLTNIRLKNNILIIKHKDEAKHPFNTANMAKLQSEQIELIGHEDENILETINEFIQKYKPFLLFKNSHSVLLDANSKTNLENQNFIVLDGSWDKAKALYFQFENLRKLPIYHLSLDKNIKSIYHPIRKAGVIDSLATVEAIAETLKLLFEQDFDSMLEALRFTVQEQKKFGPTN